jgi:hypothetical protein
MIVSIVTINNDTDDDDGSTNDDDDDVSGDIIFIVAVTANDDIDSIEIKLESVNVEINSSKC